MKDESSAPTLNTTELSLERSRLSSERTLMAWIRTSLSMISFGFTIFKFFQYLKETGLLSASRAPRGALHMGQVLVIVGTLILIPASIQHGMYLRMLKKQAQVPFPFSLAQIVAGLMAFLGLAAIANLFFRWGPF
ncbi:MAG TPA: DUF202 domain-containing protein [Deltaproteobacteria bacterium]|nr:DUF202 domain-containing protein [Deltaproteobacteria bacterium]